MDIVSLVMLVFIASVSFGSCFFMVKRVGVSLLSPVATITFFSFFYLSGWVFHISLTEEILSMSDSILLLIAMLFILVFVAGAISRPKLSKYKKDTNLNNQFILATGFILFIISMTLFYIIFDKYGLEFFFSGKGYRILQYHSMGIEKFAKDFLISSIFLLNYSYTKRRKYKSLIFLSITAITVILFILLEVRSALAIQLFSFLYFYNRDVSRIKTVYIVLLYISLLFIGGMAKEFFYHLREYLSGGEFSPVFSLVFIDTVTKHEFFAWFEIFQNLSSEIVYGETFLHSIKSFLFPGILGGESGYSPATWYVETYLPEVATRGNGRGFSLIVELYINFTIVGMMFSAFYIGRYLRRIEDSSNYFIAAFFTGTFPFIWTGNSAIFLKQYFAIFFLPAFIIYQSLRLLPKKNMNKYV